jgi:DNA-binding FadR family transcriptional regulator
MVKSDSSARMKNIEFHALMAESTHNPVITLTMKTLLDVLNKMSLEVLDNSPKNIEISGHSIIYHKKIFKALQEKNGQKVFDLMLKHVLQIQGGLKRVKSGTK